MEELARLNEVVLALSDELTQKQRELVQANRLLQAREVELERLAGTDPLTGIANRRRFSRRLADELARTHRSNRTSDTEDDVLRVADEALYGAKAAGRDRVVAATA